MFTSRDHESYSIGIIWKQAYNRACTVHIHFNQSEAVRSQLLPGNSDSMESPPCLSRHSTKPGCVQGQGARSSTGVDSDAMFICTVHICTTD